MKPIPSPPELSPLKPATQPLWLRFSHWVNALAALVMMFSGWRIYDASPIFNGIAIPRALTLGGWLGGALQWHFATMWLLVGNGVFYIALNLGSGRGVKKLFPIRATDVALDLIATLRGKLSHVDLQQYNSVQKLAYVVVIADIMVLVLSGFAIWKSVQFPLLREALVGYDNARIVHFCAMTVMAAFVVIHTAMVVVVPRSLLMMLRGR
ncbi:cytochrome b/b6 domain-containing protein [Burkholderia sp. Ac-20365]|uniref:cytochrome b/b6 domain-containing protein n=1 Tax=Burkholderia sp. Ac-20365 TaxID=2703897 RepID=UPI00197C591D|nr:cytochrome b/b6 domain-containing protein [Burkholderia sp. Ac-20365]MBN3759270.1 cytochrome B [Burkholderia sp. Ac-20365]